MEFSRDEQEDLVMPLSNWYAHSHARDNFVRAHGKNARAW